MRARWSRPLVAVALGLALLPAIAGGADARAPRGVDTAAVELGPDAKRPDLALSQARRAVRDASAVNAAAAPDAYAVGDSRYWLALDDLNQELYVKLYTLRGVGDHIEVWVASDDDGISAGTDFPAGDCRNGTRTQVTDEQVQSLIAAFDDNIYPAESSVFSVPPDRDGTGAPLAGILGLPEDYYVGEGDNIVTLVDNVRDDNFYDTNNTNTFSYIAGFFAGFNNEYLNRNVMTIDAWDWLHRTGATPPHEPTDDPCASAPARPYLYEGVFAHEYQHLLEYYEDPGETTWVNEGLSDWIMSYVGYVDRSIPVTDLGFDSHTQCFLGWLGVQTDANPIPAVGGPEQSLNLWGDQTDSESEVLCDYGAAATMMHLLADRFGADFMGAFHRDDLHGFESLQGLLDAAGGPDVETMIDTWAGMSALDGLLDEGRALKNGDPAQFQVGDLHATVNWDTDQTYSSPGAPPNGSDYVQARNGRRNLHASEVRKIVFRGAEQLPSLPLEWTVDEDARPGDPALYAGTGDNLDRAMVREVTVPDAPADLTFDARWDLEEGYDYAYVQLSTDGGASYETVACSDQVAGPLGSAWNGASAGFLGGSCDLSAWAGQSVVIAFRMVTDGSVHFDGFWIDAVSLGGTPLSDGSTLDGWMSPTGFRPTDVDGYTVRLIAYRSSGSAATRQPDPGNIWMRTLQLNAHSKGVLELKQPIGGNKDVFAIIVTYHDPTEQVTQYATYELLVNGHLQPGGGV